MTDTIPVVAERIQDIETDTPTRTVALPQFSDSGKLTHSSEGTFKTCPKKYQLAYRYGLRPKHDADPLRMGSAFHIGLEELKRGGSEMEAAELVRNVYFGQDCPPWLDDYEFITEEEACVAMVRAYARRWHGDRIVEYVAVELAFDLPIINPESGRSSRTFRNAGKIDGIGKLPDGRLAIVEHKTASGDISLGSDYWRKLQLDSQISRYVIAARALGYDVQTTVYDVTRKPEIRPKAVAKADRAIATSKGDYFGIPLTEMCPERETPQMYGARLLDDMTRRPEFYFARNEVPRLDADIEEFKWEQWSIAQQIHAADVHSRFYRNTASCTGFGRCVYLDICRSAADSNEQIPAGFKRVQTLHPELASTSSEGLQS